MVLFYVVNEKERTEFEKKFQVPYGYYAIPFFQTEDGAVGYTENASPIVRDNLIVERWEGGECEVVYRGIWYEPEAIQG